MTTTHKPRGSGSNAGARATTNSYGMASTTFRFSTNQLPVKTTLQSIVRYNIRKGFRGFEHGFRVYADRDDWGLLVCTWPKGGRPEIPVRYCDEVWTGIEYQVAAHCIMEGMVEEGMELLQALRRRYDGTRRNPYNEIE